MNYRLMSRLMSLLMKVGYSSFTVLDDEGEYVGRIKEPVIVKKEAYDCQGTVIEQVTSEIH